MDIYLLVASIKEGTKINRVCTHEVMHFLHMVNESDKNRRQILG